MKITLYTTYLTFRGGSSILVFLTKDARQADLIQYVRNNWEDTVGDDPIPEDEDDAIERFFDSDRDSYEFDDCVVDFPQLGEAKSLLNEARRELSTHPEAGSGNSKVHYAMWRIGNALAKIGELEQS